MSRREGPSIRERRRAWFWRSLQAGAVLAGVLLIAALMAGCGDDDEDEGADGNTTPAATAEATATSQPSGRGDDDAAQALRNLEIPEELADGMALGATDAPATLQVFEDFQCPNCLLFTIRIEPVILEYVEAGSLRLEFRNFPILGNESVYAAAAAVCAAEQEMFWPYHEKLFLVQAEAGQLQNEELNVGRFAPDALVDYAEEVGLDTDAFATCLQDPATVSAVETDFNTARDAGLRGTPGFILNGSAIAFPADLDAWRDVLDEATQ